MKSLKHVKSVVKFKKLTVEELMQKGYDLLNQGEYEEASLIANALDHHCHTSGFEIGARALWGRGKKKAAVKKLEEATIRFPHIYIFRDYLASYFSDLGDYDRALSLYQSCCGLDGAEDQIIQFNQAIVYGRMGNYDHALTALDQIVVPTNGDSERFICAYQNYVVSLLVKLERYAEAVIQAEEFLDSNPDNARIKSNLSKAVWMSSKDSDRAQSLAADALRSDKTDELALEVIREARAVRSPIAITALVLIEGSCHLTEEGIERRFGCYTNYEVVYEYEGQILEFIALIEPKIEPSTLKIAKIKRSKRTPNELLGIVWADPGYTLYEISDE